MSESEIVERLRGAGCVFAEDEARILVESARDDDDLARMVESRVAGTPLESVVGFVIFCGLRITVETGVFVPRQRTAMLVDEAATLLAPGATVVDLCCGTGAIGAALLARRPDLDLYAADLDPAAVHCARRNLRPERVFEGDLFEALPAHLRERVDVLVVNAPYVPTDRIAWLPPEARDHEPRRALDGGPDGLGLQRRVTVDATTWLAPGGHLVIETGSDQATRTRDLMTTAGLQAEIRQRGDATVVHGRKGLSAD